MRILYCNKYDFPFSGTEIHLFDLIERMNLRGHATALFSMDHGRSPAFSGRAYRIPHIDFKDPSARLPKKMKMAAHALYSPSARRAMRKCLTDFSPDLAHVRGVYHHLSPSILWELKNKQIPVLYHVNDFKVLCPTYNFVAGGRPCELCRQGAFRHAVTRGCYAGTRTSAAVLSAEAYLHRWLGTYQKCVNLFLAPSQFVRNKLIEGGFSPQRIVVLPHFQVLPEVEGDADGGYLLYFGRLSPEKGVDDLLRAMTLLPNVPLVIAGDGSERPRLEALSRELNLEHVTFRGTLHGEELQKLIAGCRLSIFPSHAYETLGKSILESYAWGRPVLASDLGSRREIVQHGVTGLLYEDGDRQQLAHSIGFLWDRPDLIRKMGAAARARVRAQHDPGQHIEKLLEVYGRVAASAGKHQSFPAAPQQPHPRRAVRVAFIGGRGVVSKYSGIESYYEQAGLELARLGHEVTVYCRSYFTPPMVTHNGMRVLRLPTIRSKHLETAVHTLLSTIHAMASDRDVIHYHCLGPALFSFLPRLAGKKTVVTVQGLDWQRGKWGRLASRVLRCGEAAAVSGPNATIVVSRALQQHYRQRHQCETIYIPNGAALTPQRMPQRPSAWGLAPGSYVLFLGRFSPEKNCDLLIQAFENIATNMKLVLAGGSSHTDTYVAGLRRHQSDRIRFLPWVSGDDLDELRRNAALFVLPSKLEGLSLALLEAMAAGVCVLASDIPENKEVIGDAGFTFRSGDQGELERMLTTLISDPELRRRSGARGRERILDEYQWPEIGRSIEKTYIEILGWPPTKAANRPISPVRAQLL